MKVLPVSVCTCGFNLFLICVNSQEFMRECRHAVWLMVSLTYSLYDGLGANFTIRKHPVPTTMLIVTMISGPIQYLRYTVSIGNRFLWLHINYFQSPWFHYIIIESSIFPWWLSKMGWVLFSKDRGAIKKGALIQVVLSVLWIYLKNTKLKNLGFEKNNKRKGRSGMK